MKHFFTIFILLTISSVMANDEWMTKIGKDHPRLFITQETIPLLKKQVQGVCKKDFDRIKKEVDALPDKAELIFYNNKFKLNPDGSVKYLRASQGCHLVKYTGAPEAMKASLVYLVTNDIKYQIKAKTYLKLAVKFFDWCLKHKTMAAWYNTNKVYAIVSYDWLYNSLSAKERSEIIIPLLKNVKEHQAGGSAKFHHCTGGYSNGNYGERNLQWFAGLAAYNDNFDNALARKFLISGYKLNVKMMDYRDLLSEGKGLLSAATTGYSFGAYPYASFMFLHSFKSATGEDVSLRWNHMRDYPNWFDWSTINRGSYFLDYGLGDTPHYSNKASAHLMYTHMAQSIHFFGKKHPKSAKTALRLIKTLPKSYQKFSTFYLFLPFVLFDFSPDANPDCKSKIVSKNAELFGSFGVVLMRSGTGKDDTYCLFRAGSKSGNHQHYDENHFTIYKKDFLAMDSGSRTKTMHHCYYVPQSVAHNTVLIHEEKEKMPYFWKPWGSTAEKFDNKVYYSHGGQYKQTGAKRLAFESNKFYTYVANDATEVYRSTKCAEAVRQFVFVYPDYFIVYDRVKSIKENQRKEWLLHVQNDPKKVDNKYYMADNNGGRLFFRTFLPENAIQRKVGGPGKQFLASGRNWPLPKGEKAFEKKNCFGQWRLEVINSKPQKSVRFLHLLQAGTTQTPKMIPAKLKQTSSLDGIEFIDRKGNKWEVLFNRKGKVGGEIKAWDKNGKQFLSNML